MKLAWMATVVVALLGASAAGDELVLKDGKSVAWKSLTDMGDYYDVVTEMGTKVSVPKDTVVSFRKSAAANPVLTGATMTFDKKVKLTTTDLLKSIEAKRDSVAGTWTLAGGKLVGAPPAEGHGRFIIPVTPQEEYDLTMVVMRKSGVEDLGVGIVGGGKQVTYIFDAFNGKICGLYNLGGRGADTNGTGVPGPVFEKATRTVVFMVRKAGLVIQVDGKDFFSWNADWNNVSVSPAHTTGILSKSVLYLSVYKASFEISRMTLSTPRQP